MSGPLIELLKQCVIEAGENSLRYRSLQKDIGRKASHQELVTQVDRENERLIAERIMNRFPHHRIMGEESYRDETYLSDDYVWIIDPVDGTTNYVHQKQTFAISVALYHQGEAVCGAVYNPVHEELFWAERGAGAYRNGERLAMDPVAADISEALIATYIYYNEDERQAGFDRYVRQAANRSRGLRMIGCGSLELAYVACGRFDAYFSWRQKPWDYAAGKILVEEAGGTVTRLDGGIAEAYRQGSILAANAQLHRQMLELYQAFPK